jgi:hypothetical protein
LPKIRRRVSGYNLDQLLPENGSCREQIETLTGRRTLHIAELLAGR